MPREIVIVTTKPADNTAEYGIRDTETGEWVRHGIVIPVAVESLALADQKKLADAKGVMLQVATADATSKGLV